MAVKFKSTLDNIRLAAKKHLGIKDVCIEHDADAADLLLRMHQRKYPMGFFDTLANVGPSSLSIRCRIESELVIVEVGEGGMFPADREAERLQELLGP